jgi:hypothetical protein
MITREPINTLLGRAATDDSVLSSLAADPKDTVTRFAPDASPEQIDALSQLDCDALRDFGKRVRDLRLAAQYEKNGP